MPGTCPPGVPPSVLPSNPILPKSLSGRGATNEPLCQHHPDVYDRMIGRSTRARRGNGSPPHRCRAKYTVVRGDGETGVGRGRRRESRKRREGGMEKPSWESEGENPKTLLGNQLFRQTQPIMSSDFTSPEFSHLIQTRASLRWVIVSRWPCRRSAGT